MYEMYSMTKRKFENFCSNFSEVFHGQMDLKSCYKFYGSELLVQMARNTCTKHRVTLSRSPAIKLRR